MSAAALPFAIAALVPVLVGPLPAQSSTITAALCNGGTITIPLNDDDAPGKNGLCHPKGCHAGSCRAQNDHKREKRSI
jgi:hypothetical protein